MPHQKRKQKQRSASLPAFCWGCPLIFGIGLGISKAIDGCKKLSNRFEYHTHMHPNSFMGKIGRKVFNAAVLLPDVTTHRDDLFVDVLNAGGYWINKQKATFAPAGAPIKFVRDDALDITESIKALKAKHGITDENKPNPQIHSVNRTTEQAIEGSLHYPIALVFANPYAPGGVPGLYKDAAGKNVYLHPSAKAQEESACLRSDYFNSVTQIGITPKQEENYFNAQIDNNLVRTSNEYTTPLKSTTEANVSDNHLFAIQNPNGIFHESSYLPEPKRVAFVVSAAQNYCDENYIDCRTHGSAYNDARARIETHLLAAADKAATIKAQHPGQSVELIAGAFGCGVYAPKGNSNAYRKMVADIYKELLPEFNGFFDEITFALPTFGNSTDLYLYKYDPSVANHVIFRDTMKSLGQAN